MKTGDFIKKFIAHTLKRKTTHGSYRVLKGEFCEVLVKSRSTFNQPNGSIIVAITFSKNITLFNDYSMSNMRRQVRDDIGYSTLFIVPNEVLAYDIDNFLDSGVIEIDDKKRQALIEVGDTPWLFEHDAEYERRSDMTMQYTGATKIHTRVASIEEALKHVKPSGNVCEIQQHWARAMPYDWKKPVLDKFYVDRLRTPVNPFDYGFTIEDCVAKEVYNSYSTLGGRNFSLNKGTQNSTADLAGFKAAIKEWEKALEEYQKRTTTEWEGISALEEANKPKGNILLCPEGVFMTGLVGDRYSRQKKVELKGWYKMIGKSGKVYF